jgi:hypothetical protein
MKIRAEPTGKGMWVVEGAIRVKIGMNWGLAMKVARLINCEGTVQITNDDSFSFNVKNGTDEVHGLIEDGEATIFGDIEFPAKTEIGNVVMRMLYTGTTLGTPEGPLLPAGDRLSFIIYLDPETGRIKKAEITTGGEKIEVKGREAL